MAEPTGHLVIDPFAALETERDRHEQTLKLIQAIHGLLPTRDGASKVSTGICKLCVDWSPVRRQACPGHTSAERVRKELERLATPIRRQSASQKRRVEVESTE